VKPAPFDYYAPTEAVEVLSTLAERGDDAKVLAGGQSLVPMLNMRLTRFDTLVDIGRVAEWQNLSVSEDALTIGAGVRQCEVEGDDRIRAASPLLARAIPYIGHFQIRSRGTVCGSIAHADPAAESPAVALALDATLDVSGPDGHRAVPASEFFTGTWTTTLQPADVLTAVHLPRWSGQTGFSVEEVARRHGDFAIAGVCVAIQIADGVVTKGAIAMFGLDSTPIRAAEVERSLLGSKPGELDAKEVGHLSVKDLDPPEDLHASRELRRRIGASIVARAVSKAMEEAANA
jgi:carbon-monoxide dehydrogenase medium subunit